jgi:Flp pilus assembly protein TadG
MRVQRRKEKKMKSMAIRERGQALIIIALAAIGLVAFVALAVDGSAKFSDRRQAQNAADAAAMAGALAKVNGMSYLRQSDCNCPSGTPSALCTSVQLAGLTRANENGYNDDIATNNVEIFSPPASGPYAGQCNYVQVKITSFVDTYFARILGINRTRNIVEATAFVSKGQVLGDGAMLISYDPSPGCSGGVGSGGGSFDLSGNGIVTLTGGGIFVNSDEVCGFTAPNCPDLRITGGSGINSAASVDNIAQQDCSTKNPPIAPVPERINQPPVVIPDDVTYPSVPSACTTAAQTPDKIGVAPDGKDEWLIYPGYYTDFPQASLIPNNKHIYMASGVYCIDPPHDQDLSWSGSSFLSLNGSTQSSKNTHSDRNPNGVTLYIKSGGGFSFSINSPIILDAPISGDYQGYLVILEGNQSSIESCVLNGGSYLDINGMIFAPYCNITVNGGSEPTATINAQLLGWDLKINGNNRINFTYDPRYKITFKRKIGLMK